MTAEPGKEGDGPSAAALAPGSPGAGEEGRPLSVRHFIAPAPVGGAESVVLGLAAGLAFRGHDVRVSPVLPDDPDEHPFVGALRQRDVPVEPVVVGDRAYLREWRQVRRILRSRPPDVVHTHGHRSDLLDGSVARAEGLPTVSTLHGFTDSTWRTRLYRRLQRRAYRRFDAVIAVSEPLAEELVEHGVPAGRVRRVPNAWDGDDERLSPDEARRVLGVSPDGFHVGWVGRLGREKGVDVLLRAAARLESPLTLSLVGDGAEGEALRELSGRLAIEDRVRWHGRIPGARRIFPAFDVLALSSRREGTPVVLLEAMAAGVPVVATRVGGVPDVVSPSEALLVPPEDPEALAAALRRVRDDPGEAAARAARARRRLERERDPEIWIDRHVQLYRSLLTSRRRRDSA